MPLGIASLPHPHPFQPTYAQFRSPNIQASPSHNRAALEHLEQLGQPLLDHLLDLVVVLILLLVLLLAMMLLLTTMVLLLMTAMVLLARVSTTITRVLGRRRHFVDIAALEVDVDSTLVLFGAVL